ncbi:MAG: methionine biosynthesis protein MetW [Candidatus Omnitrophota bacterium]|jgi:methionine biosynthesis protein MetW
MRYDDIRPDHNVILEIIKDSSLVLDLGCGTGELLYVLIKERKVHAQGIEIDSSAIFKCVAKGLSVFHGDIDTGLAEYEDKSFDYVILNQSLQQVRHVDTVLKDALRVGKKVIVGFPNFAHYASRLQIFFGGKTPVTGALPYQWYETPNLHFLSISDFRSYCRSKDINIEKEIYLGKRKRVKLLPNLFAQIGLFLISNSKNNQ